MSGWIRWAEMVAGAVAAVCVVVAAVIMLWTAGRCVAGLLWAVNGH